MDPTFIDEVTEKLKAARVLIAGGIIEATPSLARALQGLQSEATKLESLFPAPIPTDGTGENRK